ncbi:hypothetical protein CALCODRAFT_331789 [Calocera cornea HHB12733]|uniref:Uncharacterized protein n=1 Tax=Calocera cornea HHB12733 TaxID=1353952 RepID=A0A165F2T7_9BASI|nr:hypothetical protein CALCODRAFT_331789 [Calocera cornea HHB12733]
MGALHFPSQVAAERYLLQQRISNLELNPSAPSSESNSTLEALQLQLVALNAPIYKLSDDLLAEVFLAGMEEYPWGDEFDFAAMDKYQATLCSTVARFRRVAINTPRLWTIPTFRFVHGWAGFVGYQRDRCRDSNLPLCLFVELEAPVPDLLGGAILRDLWKRAKRAKIRDYHDWDQDPGLSGLSVVPTASSLTELSLVSFCFPSIVHLQNLLAATPGLRKLVMRSISLWSDDAINHTTTLPFLSTLELPIQIWHVLKYFDVSTCTDFRLNGSHDCQWWGCNWREDGWDDLSPEIPAAHLRSVRTLTLADWCTTQPMLVKTLCAFPSLVHLTVDGVQLWLGSENAVGECPPLEDVIITRAERVSILLPFILQSTTSDGTDDSTLRRVELDDYGDISDELLDMLQERVPVVVQNGVQLSNSQVASVR